MYEGIRSAGINTQPRSTTVLSNTPSNTPSNTSQLVKEVELVAGSFYKNDEDDQAYAYSLYMGQQEMLKTQKNDRKSAAKEKANPEEAEESL